jgi:hypothetical protein
MTSIVTSSTIDAVTSPMLAATDLAGFVSLLTVLTFMGLLIQKEMVNIESARAPALARGLDIGLVPLGYAFLVIGFDHLRAMLG